MTDITSPPMVPAANGNQKASLSSPIMKGINPRNGRNYREENRNDLRIPRLDVGTKSGKTGETTSDAVVLVQDIDAGIHRDAAQQDERGKTALVEVQPEPIESKKYPDIRNRNHKDDGKRLLQGVEQNAGRKEDDGYHHQQKQVLAVVLLAP